MKVALTGATGLLGRHLCALLTDAEVPFVPVGRQLWDLRNWCDDARFDEITDGADVFVHCAARIADADDAGSLRDLYDTNLRATLNVAQWAARRDVHLIFISSGSVYQDPHAPRIAEDAPTAPGPLGGAYAASKRLAEHALTEHAALQGLRAAILRPSSLYGVGLPQDKFLIKMLTAAHAGQGLTVTGPDNRIDFVHAHDLSRAVLLAAQNQSVGTYNISGPGLVRLAELVEAIAQFGPSGPVDVTTQPGDGAAFTRFALDHSAATQAFGYRPAVSLQTGLGMTLHQDLVPPAL